jgi:hypothetical protein
VSEEAIDRVQNEADREILGAVMKMSLEPFNEE